MLVRAPSQYSLKNEQDRFYPTTLGLALVDGYDNIGTVLYCTVLYCTVEPTGREMERVSFYGFAKKVV